MNTNTVISAIAASDLGGLEGSTLKLTSTGVDIAGATDLVIGTLVRGANTGEAVAVFLRNANGLSFVKIGNDTAIAIGDALDSAANGAVVKHTSGTIIGYAWEAVGAGSSGGDGAGQAQIRALLV